MIYLGIGLLILLTLLGLKHWLSETNPKKLLKQLRFTGLLIGFLLVLFMLATGRLAWIWAAFIAMLPWFSRLRFISGLFGLFSRQKTQQQQDTPPPFRENMSRIKAAEVLGVAVDASETEIRSAHRNLMKRNHPDQGGSPYLAQMLNQARDILLNQ